MKKLMLIAAGGAAGYVLGARAGRPAYDRMVSGWSRVSRSLGLTDVGRSVSRSAVDLRDAATERATTQVGDLMDRATDSVSVNAPQGHAADHGTIVAPTPGT
jgi:hypothetical protein